MTADGQDAAGALLRLGLAAGSPAVRALVERLERDDGHAWFAAARPRLAFRPEPPDDPRPVAVTADQLRRQWSECVGWVAHGGERGLLGTLGMVVCMAEGLRSHGTLPGGDRASAAADTLLEVAEALPTPWSDHLAKAALLAAECVPARAGDEGLRGTAPIVDRVGRYRLLEPIGRGGMGVVWRAEQAETGLHVALKLIRPELLSSRALSRFRREARLLARLRHPAIAHVLEARVETTDGDAVPYLAMELVDGEPLVAYAVQHRLAVEARLALFVQVCVAMQHAHEHGVVHRDLSPGNVLVTPDERVKVLDFGIARAIDGEADGNTRAGELVGTLAYMSPEQARGAAAAGAPDDVYALGCLLFELLAERPPHLVDALPLHEAVRQICELPPPPLRRVAPRLARDLEVIARKALEHDPARRYASARALADDVERYCRLEPIVARPPSWHYLAGKAILRHRLSFGAAASVVLALAVRLGAAGAGLLRARAAERDLVSLLRASLDLSRTLVESTRPTADVHAQLESLEAALPGDLDRRTREDPALAEAVAGLFEQVGDLEQRRGNVDTALRHRRRVLGLRQALARAHPLDHDAAARLSVALVKLGDAHGVSGGRARQRELYARALATDRGLVAAAPQQVTLRDNLVWSLLRVGHQHFIAADFEPAFVHFDEARVLAAQLVDEDPQRTLSHYALCQTWLHQVELLAHVAPGSDTHVDLARHAESAARRLRARDPDRAAFRQALRIAGGALAHALVVAGRSGEARPAIETALREAVAAAAADPARADTVGQLARLQGLMADIVAAGGDTEAAEQHTDAMLAAAERTRALDRDHPLWVRRLVEALGRKAVAAHERGDAATARRFGHRALDLCERLEGSRVELLLLAQLLWRPFMAERRDVPRAEALLARASEGGMDRGVMEVLAHLHRALGRDAQAAECEQRITALADAWRSRFPMTGAASGRARRAR